MINYLILAGALLATFALILLIQNIYMMKLSDDKHVSEVKKMAFWGILVSSTMIGIGIVIIGISVFAHIQTSKAPPIKAVVTAPKATTPLLKVKTAVYKAKAAAKPTAPTMPAVYKAKAAAKATAPTIPAAYKAKAAAPTMPKNPPAYKPPEPTAPPAPPGFMAGYTGKPAAPKPPNPFG